MQTKGPLFPELNDLWNDSIAGPKGWSRHSIEAELCGVPRHLLLKREARFECSGLLGCPGTDLRIPRSRREISVGFGIADYFHRTVDPDLAPGSFPIKA